MFRKINRKYAGSYPGEVFFVLKFNVFIEHNAYYVRLLQHLTFELWWILFPVG